MTEPMNNDKALSACCSAYCDSGGKYDAENKVLKTTMQNN